MTEPSPPDAAALPDRGDRIEIVVGRVARAHGLTGDVVIDVRTDEPERRFAVGQAFRTDRGELVLEAVRWHGGRLLARFNGAVGRDGAERLRGVELRVDVPVDQRPDDPDEYYDHQIRGLAAHVEEHRIGSVADVLHLPEQDVLVLDVDGREVLVPFVSEIVTEIDLDAGRLEIRDRPGLLTDVDADAKAAGGAEDPPT